MLVYWPARLQVQFRVPCGVDLVIIFTAFKWGFKGGAIHMHSPNRNTRFLHGLNDFRFIVFMKATTKFILVTFIY